MSSFWHMSRMMDRIMDEYLREMHRSSNQPIAPYWRDADHSVLQVANEAHQVIDDDKKFAISLDVSQFKPEELKVNLDGRLLTVEGKQECKNENSFMARYDQMLQSYVKLMPPFSGRSSALGVFPEDVNLEGLKTELSDKGKLTIEAPKNPNTSKKSIPIQHGSSCSHSQSTHSHTHTRSRSRRDH
ncbi:Hsp20/alpha crystallin family protein [Ostertagia ostertagi]